MLALARPAILIAYRSTSEAGRGARRADALESYDLVPPALPSHDLDAAGRDAGGFRQQAADRSVGLAADRRRRDANEESARANSLHRVASAACPDAHGDEDRAVALADVGGKRHAAILPWVAGSVLEVTGPALSPADQRRLSARRVWRGDELEDERAEEVERYAERSSGRLAISLDVALHLIAPGDDVLELGSEPWLFTQMLIEHGITPTTAAKRPGDSAESERVTIEWDGRRAVVEQRIFDAEHVRWPYADECFDCVLCMEVVEHLSYSPANVLHEANRVLRPGGRLLLTTPNALAARKLVALLRGRNVYAPYSGFGPFGRHNREFTPEEVRLILEESGFAAQVRTANLAGYEASDTPTRLAQRLAAVRGRRPARRREHIFATARKVAPPRLAMPPSLYVAWDRERARRLGLTLADELPGDRD
jgi:SAM-dependent methyltransferase